MDNVIVCPWCSTELSATRPSWVSHHADGSHTVTEQERLSHDTDRSE